MKEEMKRFIESHNVIRGGDPDEQNAMRESTRRLEEFIVEEGRKANALGYSFRCFCAARHSPERGKGAHWSLAERMRMIREAFRL